MTVIFLACCKKEEEDSSKGHDDVLKMLGSFDDVIRLVMGYRCIWVRGVSRTLVVFILETRRIKRSICCTLGLVCLVQADI